MNLHFEGLTQADIAERIGTSLAVVRKALSDPDVQELVYDKIDKEVASIMRNGALKAAAKLVEQIGDENPWIAQNAARAVLQYDQNRKESSERTVVVSFGMGMPEPGMPTRPSDAIDGDGDVE